LGSGFTLLDLFSSLVFLLVAFLLHLQCPPLRRTTRKTRSRSLKAFSPYRYLNLHNKTRLPTFRYAAALSLHLSTLTCCWLLSTLHHRTCSTHGPRTAQSPAISTTSGPPRRPPPHSTQPLPTATFFRNCPSVPHPSSSSWTGPHSTVDLVWRFPLRGSSLPLRPCTSLPSSDVASDC
jgi:hypothetical protein